MWISSPHISVPRKSRNSDTNEMVIPATTITIIKYIIKHNKLSYRNETKNLILENLKLRDGKNN